MSWRITTLAEVRLMPKPPALVDRRNTNIPISVLNSSIRCILQNTRHHESGLGKHTTLAPELNTEVGIIFWKRGQWHRIAAPKCRCFAAGKRVPTVLCSDHRNILKWHIESKERKEAQKKIFDDHRTQRASWRMREDWSTWNKRKGKGWISLHDCLLY